MTLDLFKDILPSIMKKKVDLSEEQDFNKVYNAYVVNKALSFYNDCLPYVNMLNCYPKVDKVLHYHFLLNSIRPMDRKFKKWEKKLQDEALDSIQEYFQCSIGKAKEISVLLTNEQRQEIIKKMEKGGVVK